MSELKTYKMVDEKYCTDSVCVIPSDVYMKSEVDAAIAELKAENERLKAPPEQIMIELFDKVLIYPHEKVRLEDAYKLAVSLKNTKRALWLSRLQSLRNFSVIAYFQMIRAKGKESSMDFNEMAYRIDLARVKCRAKAEEYK